MSFYAIAVDTMDYDLRRYETRYWGAGSACYLWHSEAAALHYMSDLDDGWLDGKTGGPRHIVDDVYVIEVTDIPSVSPTREVIFPWFSTPHYSNEGYDTKPKHKVVNRG